MKRFWQRLVCRWRGHDCEPTGRHALLLHEWQCRKCDGRYVSHIHYDRVLLPADADSDRIFRDMEKAIQLYAKKSETPETPAEDQSV